MPERGCLRWGSGKLWYRLCFYSLRKLDVLQELLEDPTITEIMVNGAEHIFYEKAGRLYKAEYGFSSKEKLNDVIQQMDTATVW